MISTQRAECRGADRCKLVCSEDVDLGRAKATDLGACKGIEVFRFNRRKPSLSDRTELNLGQANDVTGLECYELIRCDGSNLLG